MSDSDDLVAYIWRCCDNFISPAATTTSTAIGIDFSGCGREIRQLPDAGAQLANTYTYLYIGIRLTRKPRAYQTLWLSHDPIWCTWLKASSRASLVFCFSAVSIVVFMRWVSVGSSSSPMYFLLFDDFRYYGTSFRHTLRHDQATTDAAMGRW